MNTYEITFTIPVSVTAKIKSEDKDEAIQFIREIDIDQGISPDSLFINCWLVDDDELEIIGAGSCDGELYEIEDIHLS